METYLIIVLVLPIVLSMLLTITQYYATKDYKKHYVIKVYTEGQRKSQEENERFNKELQPQFQAERENDGDETT